MSSGSALVSTIATTGIPRRRASLTAFCSRIVSITTRASGSCDISRIPRGSPELRGLAVKRSQFLLSHFLVFGRLLDLFDVFQSPNAFANRSEISQCAAEPALVHVKLSASYCSLLYCFLRLLLAADE